ncbi:MAG: T9SS type A sorting domain-containing protein [Bacteroidia bacterium]
MKHVFLLLSLLSANAAFSIDRFVDPNLSSGNGTTLFTTITSAVNAALDGDRILINGNTFNEAALTLNKSLKILPYVPGTVINFNQSITIIGFPGMNIEITGLNIGNYSFFSSLINGGMLSNRAKVSFIDCAGTEINFPHEFYYVNVLGCNLSNGISICHGAIVGNTTKYIVLLDETQNNPNTIEKMLILNNNVTYMIGVFNNDYPFFIANNSLRDLSVIRWNANVSLENKIINNDFKNDATINFSSVNVPYYNIIFSSNKFIDAFLGVSASDCWPNNSNLNGNYNETPVSTVGNNYNYNEWFPTWNWCCNGPSGWYCANWPSCSTEPTRPPSFMCYQWTTNGSSKWPNFNANGFFEWTYNGIDFAGIPSTPTILNFNKIIGPANPINGGKPTHDYYDLDLTVNDRGINGGPYSSINFYQGIGLTKAKVFYLDMAVDLFSDIELNIKANAVHCNASGGANGTGLNITGAEYFFGTFDPGQGNGTAIFANDNNFDNGIENLFRSQATWGELSNPTLFNIRVKDANGNWGPVFKRTVFPYGSYPNAQLIEQGDSVNICPNSAVTLTYNGPNGYTPTWFNGSNANSVTFIPEASGYYNVSALLGNSTYIDSIYVDFILTPTPTVSPSDSILVCSSSTIVLSTSILPNTSLQWFLNSNPIAGAINNTYLPTQPGVYYVRTTSTLTGCAGQSDNITLFSTFSISANGSTTSTCSSPVTLFAPGINGAIYQWKINGSNISGATFETYIPSQSGTYSVTISSGNCITNSQTILVTYIDAPLTPTITSSGPTTFCAGGSVTLTSSSTTGNTWSNGQTSQSITVSQGGNYSVSVSSGNCSATSIPSVVAVNAAPATPTISANGPTTFCTGGSVTLTSSSATGNTWSNGQTSQSITVYQAGNYSVSVSNGSCSANSVVIPVFVVEGISIILQPEDQIVFENESAFFAVETSGSGIFYQWQINNGSGFQDILDGGQFAGANSATLTISDIVSQNNNQAFRCVLTDGFCSDTTLSGILTVESSVGFLVSSPNIAIYPNPAVDILFIDFSKNNFDYGCKLSILNSMGKLVYVNSITSEVKQVDISEWASGVYFIQIWNAENAEISSRKIVIE